ncbi:unnamed protein product [Rotaria sp. Silwood1]|nr:unnamed protein product [Rotaria sp. Silwood1]CAF0749929.1 unnamed protein product [Rotaria sp. Silwood1]CAF0806883.1 unnamed protein product [Rotaria sp. Silwood1]CAF4493122.1 unnamed protein product [Rotaria sp. Silwood1]CAF4615014.1 unnamed protein product [Rotaria sp. Silwood1]
MASDIEIELNETQLRVSSVLNKDNKNYGKKNLIDGNEETCWNSEAGSPQWIQITPMKCITLNSIAIKFQGGFAAKRFVIEDRQQDGTFTSIAEFYPDNHGKLQISFFYLFYLIFLYVNVFRLPTAHVIDQVPFRLTFYDSYDTFGRIIIYVLKIYENK